MSASDRSIPAFNVSSDWEEAMRAIAQHLQTAGDATSIAGHLEVMRRQACPSARSWAALGQALTATGWLDEADATFRALAASYPAEPAGTVGRARVAARRRDWVRALELWANCLEQFPRAAKPEWRAEHANALFRVGRLDEAEASFSRLAVSHPDLRAAFVGLARVATRRRNWDSARDRWATCLERFPAQATATWRMALGDALFELKRYEDATAVYRQVLREAPDHPRASLRLATIASSDDATVRGDLMAAATELERSVERAPADLDLRVRLVALWQSMGKLNRALAHSREALQQWRRCHPTPQRSVARNPSPDAAEIHLVSPFRAVGGRTRRCIELFRALKGKCPVRLWSPQEFGPAVPMFAEEFSVETIAPQDGRYPRHGTLVLIGPELDLDWLRLATPDRVILICNILNLNVMMRALDAMGRAGIHDPELVYASELIRDATGMPGIVEQSLIDLDRFAPRPQRRREADDFVVGRMSRDVLVKHHPDDLELYRALAEAGCRIRLMGATCLEPRLRGVPGVELLPADGDAAATFLQGLDCFLYRTSNASVEAFGRVVSEAMACGLPVVCHRNGGYRDFIEDGKNGFLFDTNAEAQAIVLRLMADPEMWSAISLTARRSAEALNGPAARRAIADFYLARTR